jgi:uncharacterized protein YndB with AHSA1/START domain
VADDPVNVTVERRIAAPADAVFDAWLDPAGARRWLFATPDGVMEKVEIDARVGGGFRIEERRSAVLAQHFGEYVEIDRPRRLAFDFWTNFSAERTRVTVTIVPDGAGALLTLRHEGVWADYEARTEQGWTMILGNLERSLA